MNMPIWPVGQGIPEIAEDVDAIVLDFSRQEVEGLCVGRAVDDLMLLSDDRRLRRQLAHSVLFCFSGWDADPREVNDIPECRRYLQALHQQWNFWLHFLAPLPDMWSVLLLCLVEKGEHQPWDGQRRAFRVNPVEVKSLVTAMVLPSRLLHDDMGLAERERAEIVDRSLAAIDGCWK